MEKTSVIWKRPDGFHGAAPEDFVVVDIGGESRLWLHKTDHDNFPFRVSGTWQGEDLSKKVNKLVNLISKQKKEWLFFLKRAFEHSSEDSKTVYLENLNHWLEELSQYIKGDTWEELIMKKTFQVLRQNLLEYKKDFVSS